MIVECFACRKFLFVPDKTVNWIVCECGSRCFGWDDHSSSMSAKRSTLDTEPTAWTGVAR